MDLNKVKAFNETLFQDLFKRDNIRGKLSFEESCSKSYMVVPLRLAEATT
jgi:hypothetical protein